MCWVQEQSWKGFDDSYRLEAPSMANDSRTLDDKRLAIRIASTLHVLLELQSCCQRIWSEALIDVMSQWNIAVACTW